MHFGQMLVFYLSGGFLEHLYMFTEDTRY